MGKLKTIKNRIYSDYLMPSKLDKYEKILQKTIEREYQYITLRDYNYKLKNNLLENSKYFINRHDIDTDVSTAKKFFEIEKKYNIKATYYFRLSTLDFNFMKELEEYGSEASYHFEEIAQYAKDYHIKNRDEIINRLDDIKEIFIKNFKKIENELNIKLKTVCSHGDFVNRKLKIINNEILKDDKLRERLGIECEAYDKDIMESFDIYISDGIFGLDIKVEDILDKLENKKVVCMLSHPRQWRVNIYANSIENLKRFYEGIVW